MNNHYSITKEQSEAIDKMFHNQEILISLREAYSILGDIKLSEAIEKMKRKTFYNEPSDELSQLDKLRELNESLIQPLRTKKGE